MIFGRMTSEGREFVLVGLSDENIAMMKTGEPVTIGPVPGDPALAGMMIVIAAGDTEASMVRTLKLLSLVSPETTTTDTP